MTENEISYIVRGCIFKIFNELGPGLFEKVYVHVLKYELEKNGLDVQMEYPMPVIYEDVYMDVGFRIDLMVNNKVIIEVKSIEALQKMHHKQVLTYLKLSGKKLALLVNFNGDNIAENIHRKVNGLI